MNCEAEDLGRGLIARAIAAVLLVLPGACLTSCASLPTAFGRGPPCALLEQDALLLRGETDATMLRCLRTAARPSIRKIVVDSPGGPVKTGIAIAEIVKALDVEVIVRGQCNSSCANYVLPAARRITLKPGALVMIHGSIDDNLLAKGAPRELYDMQRAFAEIARIHPGWLLFRTPAERAAGSNGRHVSGAPQVWRETSGAISVRQILTEEAFMRSCLPGKEIVGLDDTVARRVYLDARLRDRLARQGIYPSGTLLCTSPATPSTGA